MPKPFILPESMAYKAGMLSAQAQHEALQSEVHAREASRLRAEVAALLQGLGLDGSQRVVLVPGAKDPEGRPLAIGTVIDAQGRACMLPDPPPEPAPEKIDIPFPPDLGGTTTTPANGMG